MNTASLMVPNKDRLSELSLCSVLPYFSDLSIQFITTLSSLIQKNSAFRQLPEMQALAFWMRKSHLLSLKEQYKEETASILHVGHGTVFHIAPANVDSIFFYSWFISLLCGNKNIIRISPRTMNNIAPLLSMVHQLLDEEAFLSIKKRNLIVSYDRNDQTTALLSQYADLRVIWGGDSSIEHIRKITIPPHAKELTFSSKFSLAMIHTDRYLELDSNEKEALAVKFYNDAYWFGQQACSSPRLICWTGESASSLKAQTIFWKALDLVIAKKELLISTAELSNKYCALQALTMNNVGLIPPSDTSHYISRIHLNTLNHLPKALHCGNGLFFEYTTHDIHTVFEAFTPDIQTISYYGYTPELLKNIYLTNGPKGAVRFVPMGQALDFHEIWDGYSLFSEFSKRISFL